MRKPRLIIPGAPHHFIVRGNNRRRLFSFNWEKDFFQTLLAEASAEFGCPIHALALMDNHSHLVATPPSKDAASGFVHSFAQRYAQHRNKVRGSTGKLFEREFVSYPILTEAYLAQKIAYVDFNAVHHGMCHNPADYPWTTYGLHVGRAEVSRIRPALRTPSDWYLGLGEQRCEIYRRWVADCISLDQGEASQRDFRLRRPDESRAS
jgi:putative transposase